MENDITAHQSNWDHWFQSKCQLRIGRSRPLVAQSKKLNTLDSQMFWFSICTIEICKQSLQASLQNLWYVLAFAGTKHFSLTTALNEAILPIVILLVCYRSLSAATFHLGASKWKSTFPHLSFSKIFELTIDIKVTWIFNKTIHWDAAAICGKTSMP